MKKVLISIFLVALGCGAGFAFRSTELETQLRKIQEKEEADLRLGQYAINMMYATPAGKLLSDGRKQSLAQGIVRVANDIFNTEENKKAFVAVIAIESGFQKLAQSPTGPKGYSQVARKSFYEALEACGVSNLNDDDVWDTDLNLYAGACYFQKLLIQHNQDPFLAIVAYNQGPNSEAIKTFSKSGSLESPEALKYVAKFTFLNRTVKDEKQPNIPAIQDLPRPDTKSKGSKKD
jgi:soluble lytic murein transglycosylase-like protein